MLKRAPVNEDWKIKSKSLKNCVTAVELWVIFFSSCKNNMYNIVASLF